MEQTQTTAGQLQKATPKQKSAIGAYCHRLFITADQKHTIVSSFSQGRCTSSNELTQAEATQMLQYLAAQVDDKDKAKMIGKIFYYCHQMAWTKLNDKGKTVADCKRFDEWAVVHSYLKKKLDRYSYAELPKLVSQFAQVYKSYLNKF